MKDTLRVLKDVSTHMTNKEKSIGTITYIVNLQIESRRERQKGIEAQNKLRGERRKRKAAETKLRIDKLTGTYRNDYFRGLLRRGLQKARENKQELSILKIDLGNLKIINENLGYEAGDEYLKKGSSAILEAVRSSDVLVSYDPETGRFGDKADEFAVILPGANSYGAEIASERVADEVYTKLGRVCSIGTRTYLPDFSKGYSIKQFLNDADQALRVGKEQRKPTEPRSGICVYEKTFS